MAVPVAVKKDIPSEPLPAGSLKLTLHKARKLEKKGAFGKADPYTVLTVGKEKFKTATVSNNQNPEWNHTITFDLTKDTEEEMTVEVFDSDIGKDDRLGDTKISLREICHQRNVVYEIRCLTCQELETNKIIEQDITQQEKVEQQNKIKLFKYIGETSRIGVATNVARNM